MNHDVPGLMLQTFLALQTCRITTSTVYLSPMVIATPHNEMLQQQTLGSTCSLSLELGLHEAKILLMVALTDDRCVFDAC